MINTAIILAGGKGERLRPLTEKVPKVLLTVAEKPILEHIINNLKKYGITNIILSTFYRAEQIKEYFKDGSELGVSIKYSHANHPLGTGGSIKRVVHEHNLQKPFFLVWGDNLADIDYNMMYKDYLRDAPQITMALTPQNDIEHFGVAQLDDNTKIVNFIEKPKKDEISSNLINAGAFIIEPQCLDILPETKCSMEKDCFEKLAPLGEISAHIHQGYWFPSDTLEKYQFTKENFIYKQD